MNKRTIMIVISPGSYKYLQAFDNKGFEALTFPYEYVYARKDLSTIDLICFTGGEDIDPRMYGEAKHKTTVTNLDRDIIEADLYNRALEAGIPMVGICRGAQLLTVMNGGKLIQHVDNHAMDGRHPIRAICPPSTSGTMGTGNIRKQFQVTSTHHQMMYPYNLCAEDFNTIGWSTNICKSYEGLPDIEYERYSMIDKGGLPRTGTIEPEVIYYNKTNCLAFQYHPEIMSKNEEGYKYFHNAINKYLFGEDVQF